MIYKKNVNFPYPVLQNSIDCYGDCEFDLDIKDTKENKLEYEFKYEFSIGSEFIRNLIKDDKATLYLIIHSGDNKFFEVNLDESELKVNRNKLHLSKRTEFQMMIKANENINFKKNNDITGLYAELKDEIVVDKNSILGFSNIVTLEESKKEGIDLFEKKVDKNLKSEIKIELTNDIIIIIYRDEAFQFSDQLNNSGILNNLYVYMGLQKALYKFIEVNKGQDEEEVDLEEMDLPNSELDKKLYKLMKGKMIRVLNMDNIDEVIYLISDGIIEKFTNKIKGYINDRD
ncbi:MAG: hypothetical protein ACRDAU_09005 [Clostridium sp.]